MAGRPGLLTMKRKLISAVLAAGLLCACGPVGSAATEDSFTTGQFIRGNVLESAEGEIHYSYWLPDGYDGETEYPLMMTLPGYGGMWFGEDSEGTNLRERGVSVWTEIDEPMIVVSPQVTDWHDTSARQTIELTEYFLENFAVDRTRVYGAGYSAGGETMSRVMGMRPDLFAAYLHGASQWDGEFAPAAQSKTAIYIFMGEHDEYYGSDRAREAFKGLLEAYRQTGLDDEEIDELLRLWIPDDAWFADQGITNQHGGGNVLFEEDDIREWLLEKKQ